jgi:hypothetical protein
MYCSEVKAVAAVEDNRAYMVGTTWTASKNRGLNIREYLQLRKDPFSEVVEKNIVVKSTH